MPFLRRSPRISLGWQQRTLQEAPDGPFDLWIQAASGGESLLTKMILENLAATLPQHKTIRVFATSGTKQGVDSLEKSKSMVTRNGNVELHIAFFPFDAPYLMKQAFARIAPKLAIIVETELWPGFLITAHRKRVPVFLINGRMSEKSFNSYRYFQGFFRKYGPEKIIAISPLDGDRFAKVNGPERVSLMHNIKFDRIEPKDEFPTNASIASLLPAAVPFVLLGSVRQEEEDHILKTITSTLARRSDIIIGLFPKHVERSDHWLALLQKQGITAVRRSQVFAENRPGTVIIWDVFGELAGAYALAAATFVGGSLVNLGGQNFLEPLVFGLKPIIGPYWKNFAWVGRDIVTSGLVHEVADADELTEALLTTLESGCKKTEILEQVHRFFEPRKGGTKQIGRLILDQLNCKETH